MNNDKLKRDKGLVCTCNDLRKAEVIDSAHHGCGDADEFMYQHATFFRCGECKPIINRLINATPSQTDHGSIEC